MTRIKSYLKCCLLVLCFSILPMIVRIIGIGFLTKFTDDYKVLYLNAYTTYGKSSDELKLVVDYGGTFFTWIGLALISLFLVWKDHKDIKGNVKIEPKVFYALSLGIILSTVLVFTNTDNADYVGYKGIWVLCYVLQAILTVVLENLVFRYECLKYLKEKKKWVRFLIPLVLYLMTGKKEEIVMGIILYTISYFLYTKTDNLMISFSFNLGLTLITLMAGAVKTNVLVILSVVSIIMCVILAVRERVSKC